MAIGVRAGLNGLEAEVGVDLGLGSLFGPNCEGSGCYTFSRLIPGTLVTVTMDSGNIFSDVIFVGFDDNSCTVTLKETLMISPLSTTIIKLDCQKVESIAFPV